MIPGSRKQDSTLGNGGAWGGGLGIIFAVNMEGLIRLLTRDGRPYHTQGAEVVLGWFIEVIAMLFVVGPTAMLCATGVTAILRKFAGRFAHRRRLILAGISMGVPVGLLHVAVIWALFLGNIKTAQNPSELSPAIAFLLAEGIAGGIGLGLGAALAVPFPRPAGTVEMDHGPN